MRLRHIQRFQGDGAGRSTPGSQGRHDRFTNADGCKPSPTRQVSRSSWPALRTRLIHSLQPHHPKPHRQAEMPIQLQDPIRLPIVRAMPLHARILISRPMKSICEPNAGKDSSGSSEPGKLGSHRFFPPRRGATVRHRPATSAECSGDPRHGRRAHRRSDIPWPPVPGSIASYASRCPRRRHTDRPA